MKTSMILFSGLAVIALLACAGCTPNQTHSDLRRTRAFSDDQLKYLVTAVRPNVYVAQPGLLARALSLAPLNERFITPCVAGSTPTATRIVKIRIDNSFDVKSTGRNVVSKKSNGAGIRPVKEPNIVPGESTTYDLLLDKTVWDATDNYIAIKVILKDQNLIFPSDNAAVTTVGAPTDPSMFVCIDRIEFIEDKKNNDPEDGSNAQNPKYETTTVYIDRNQIMKQKFNIRIIALHRDKVHALPLIIDPSVENDGFN